MSKLTSNIYSYLTISIVVLCQLYIAINEEMRLSVIKYYESFILFFVNQQDITIMLTAAVICIISILITIRNVPSLGKNVSVGIIYMVGIMTSKELYTEISEASMQSHWVILMMFWFIVSVLLVVIGILIIHIPSKSNDDVLGEENEVKKE